MSTSRLRVIKLHNNGMTNKEIAEELNLNESTVINHLVKAGILKRRIRKSEDTSVENVHKMLAEERQKEAESGKKYHCSYCKKERSAGGPCWMCHFIFQTIGRRSGNEAKSLY